MTYPLVQELVAEGFPVRLTCGVLGFSTQAFYKWRARPCSDRDYDNALLTNRLVDLHAEDPTLGYRFLADELEQAGHRVGERRVWRLCREQRLWSNTVRKGRHGKRPGPAVHDDLVQRNFTAGRPDQVWLTDITEHPTAEGKLYCCAIKDVFSNRIVGYSIGDRMTAQLATGALRTAIARRQPTGTVVVHGPRRFRRGQRRDGVVLRVAATQRACLRHLVLDRAQLQPSPPATRPRQAHPSRVRARLHHRRGSRRGMISLTHRQPNQQQSPFPAGMQRAPLAQRAVWGVRSLCAIPTWPPSTGESFASVGRQDAAALSSVRR